MNCKQKSARKRCRGDEDTTEDEVTFLRDEHEVQGFADDEDGKRPLRKTFNVFLEWFTSISESVEAPS